MIGKSRKRLVGIGALGMALSAFLALSLACGGAAATATPARAPTTAPAPTAAPAPTRAPVAAPTAIVAPVAAKEKPQYGGTLRFPLSFSIDAPDPAYSIQTGTRRVLYLLYNGLVKLMPDGTVGPDLARSWEISSDGKTVTFSLQKGVKFHDGTNLDAQAVKWNYDRFLDQKVGSPRSRELSPPLQRVDVVDDSTVRFSLSAPFRPLLANLTQQAGQITSPAAVQKYNSYADRIGEFGRKPVGSGPFKLQEWLPGSHFSLVRNESYWEQGLPYLDGIRLPIIGDKQIQFAMLRTGEVEVMESLRAEDVEIALRNPNVNVQELKGASITTINFRLGAKPWDNKPLRQAFGYAVDRKAFGDILFRGRAVPAQSIVGPSFGQWYDPTIQVYDYNPDKVKQKLAEAGYPKGFTFKAICASAGTEADECEVLQPILAKAGITMEIQTWEVVTYFSDFLAGRHQGPLVSFWSPRPEPSINIRRLYHTKGSANSWDYSNPELDKLIEEAETIYDITKAKEVYRKALTLIADDASTIYIAAFNVIFGVRDNVHNFAPVSDTVPRLRDLWLSK